MKTEISIWGIRRGFEKEGFFHTHNYAATKESQQDRFRNICNTIGNKGFFNIQHIQGKTIISYIDSGVREFYPGGARPGYVVFSLIISNQEVFEKSPRAVLLELSHFYRSRVGASNQNNFNSAEIEFFLNKLTIAPAPALQIRENISSYTYYADASHIDHFLTGNIPFASFGELIFIPSEYNPTTGKFKELDFIDDSFRSNPQFIDLRLAESRFMKERESDLEKQRIAEQQKKEKQLQIQLIEQVLINMIKLGKFDEANQKYEQFPHKADINQGITNQLYEHKRVQEDQVKEILTLKQEADLIDSIIMAERKGDLDLALSSYKKLNNKNHANLTVNLKTKLENYDADLKQQRESEEQQKIAKAEANNARTKRKKMFLSFSILAIIGLCATSFFLKLPEVIWAENNKKIVKNKSNLLKKTKQINLNNKKEGQDTKKLKSVTDDPMSELLVELKKPEGIHVKKDQNSDLYNQLHKGVVFLRYVENKNKYEFDKRDEGKSKWMDLTEEDIETLNEYFKLDVPVKVDVIKQDEKQVKNTGADKEKVINPIKPKDPKGKAPIDFPKNLEQEVYTCWSNIISKVKSSINKNRFKKISKEYFDGVISGKYKENSSFGSYLKDKEIQLDIH